MSPRINAASAREFAAFQAFLLNRTKSIREKKRPDGSSWRRMLETVFSAYVREPYASYHVEFWEWVFAIRADANPRPYVTIWPRGSAKSTSCEVAAAVFAALETRKYILYVCATQAQANDHVQNIGALLESPIFEKHFPRASRRKIGRYGHARAWRQNRLRTENGTIIHAIGLDSAARGAKVEGERPDAVICDDLDELADTPLITEKKIATLTKSILPAAGSVVRFPAFIYAQNLILSNGIAARLVNGDADFLHDRIVSGPHPAVHGLTIGTDDEGKPTIIAGVSSWDARSIESLEAELRKIGTSAFLAELQHEVQNLSKGMFAAVEFRRCNRSEVPDLADVQVWCDPATTDTKLSDSQGIQVDGVTAGGQLYRLYSWEARTSPRDAIVRAIRKAREYGASCVGIETDQGGDTWEDTYERAWQTLVSLGEIGPFEKMLPMKQAKAGSIGSKAFRAGQMLADYERANIIHVIGTEAVLERALRRFLIEKPYDLVDAAYWSWKHLDEPPAAGVGSSDYTENDEPEGRVHPVWGRQPG